MTLRQKQSKFALMVAHLIIKAYELGYEVTLGDAYRDHRLHGAPGIKLGYGHPKSAHKIRLAVDLNLFLKGVFLTDTESFRPLGMWWKTQDVDCRWGGDFKSPDGNHFSCFHEGVK